MFTNFAARILTCNAHPNFQLLFRRKESVKTGIVMMNMGGPQTLDQVPEYLFRIMTDVDMIQLPFQKYLGPYIAKRRTSNVQKKYSEIGGGSPILKWTNLQGELMCKKLNEISPDTAPHKHYVAFRYANPLTDDTLDRVIKDSVERVVFFSQYPQYSCATSGSSFNAIFSYFLRNQIPKNIKWSVIDRWSTNKFFIKTITERISNELKCFPEDIKSEVVIIFSAHSLPIKAVVRGDAYPAEVAATVQAVMDELGHRNPFILTWQSKVGPIPWLGPFTDEVIKAYVEQGIKHFIMVPVAFVNEHIETLHEMDIEYCKDLGTKVGAEIIARADAPNDHPLFIDALADIVSRHLRNNESINPKFLLQCPFCENIRCIKSKQFFKELCK